MALGSDALQIGLSALTVPGDYRKRTDGGASASSAMLGAAASGAQMALLSVPSTIALSILPLLPVAARGLISFGMTQSRLIRQRATPFSHRLEASQMAAQQQGYALSRMGEMSGLGNEAPHYAGRYGRG